ncbi:MAG: hypothetical protein KKB79_03615 [Nanoarchaeota archaeon]|nr:hypothetical protein [Nanoarchaeota archaeon]
MVESSFVNAVSNTLNTPIGSVNWFVQAIGGIVVIYVGLAIINFILNLKKNKEIKKIGKDVREIKKILDKSKKR